MEQLFCVLFFSVFTLTQVKILKKYIFPPESGLTEMRKWNYLMRKNLVLYVFLLWLLSFARAEEVRLYQQDKQWSFLFCSFPSKRLRGVTSQAFVLCPHLHLHRSFCFLLLFIQPHLHKLTPRLITDVKQSQEEGCSTWSRVFSTFEGKECSTLTDQQSGVVVWECSRQNGHKMSLFQLFRSWLIQLFWCFLIKYQLIEI